MITRRHILCALRRPFSLQQAIDDAARRGGGTVHIPSGRHPVASINLRSNVSLFLDNGAVLDMNPRDDAFFAPETFPYNPHADNDTSLFRPALFYGEGLENLSIHGFGVIEANRRGSGGPKPIALRRCRRVSIRGIKIQHAGNYAISLLGCRDVESDGVTIANSYKDGIDPDCCQNVRIANCFIESVNDAICLKSSPALGEKVLTENITVTNCTLRTASIHLKCGTESYGGFRNITFSNCTLEGGMGLRHGNPGIALYAVDGGSLEGVAISNITMHNVGTPLALRHGARGRGPLSPQPGRFVGVTLSNIVARAAHFPSLLSGLPNALLEDVSLSNIQLHQTHPGQPSGQPVPELPTAYPDPAAFGPLPASVLYVRHARGLRLRDLVFRPAEGDSRPVLVTEDVTD